MLQLREGAVAGQLGLVRSRHGAMYGMPLDPLRQWCVHWPSHLARRY
jgi:hypothetical protein